MGQGKADENREVENRRAQCEAERERDTKRCLLCKNMSPRPDLLVDGNPWIPFYTFHELSVSSDDNVQCLANWSSLKRTSDGDIKTQAPL